VSSSNGSGSKGGRRQATAARAEKQKGGKSKALTFNGVKFKLPAVLPDTILFDMVEVESQGSSPLPMFRMLRSILGQEQFAALREAVESETIPAEELDRFIEALFSKYGVTPGEPSASRTS